MNGLWETEWKIGWEIRLICTYYFNSNHGRVAATPINIWKHQKCDTFFCASKNNGFTKQHTMNAFLDGKEKWQSKYSCQLSSWLFALLLHAACKQCVHVCVSALYLLQNRGIRIMRSSKALSIRIPIPCRQLDCQIVWEWAWAWTIYECHLLRVCPNNGGAKIRAGINW